MAVSTSSGISGLIGSSVQRVEDQKILRGRGRYVGDITLPAMLHATFLRSPYPHARIVSIDVTTAAALPGVAAVITGADLAKVTNPMALAPSAEHKTPASYALATDKVRLVGDLVAMVVADSRYVAEDARDLIQVEYEPLPPVPNAATALDPSSTPLFEEVGSNIAYKHQIAWGDLDGAFARADRVVSVTLDQHRYANSPMETRGGIGDYNPATGEMTYHASCQSPHLSRFFLSGFLNQPIHQLRIVNSDVGGAFGLKAGVFREDIAILAASRMVGRPVRWIEDRAEHLTASGHAREETMEMQAAVTNDGTLLGLKCTLVMDQGAYPMVPHAPPMYAAIARVVLPSAYRIDNYSFDTTIVFSNKATYLPYRGPWEIETWARERLFDIIAHELGLDPIDVRRTNLLTKDELPRPLVTGPTLNGIVLRDVLERAVQLADYAGFRARQQQAREEGRYLGIGVASFIEPAPGPPNFWPAVGIGGPPEQARVRVEPTGQVTVFTSQAPHGQGHETTLAQVVAQELGVAFDQVKVVHGDTAITQFSLFGTGGSRASSMASGAAMYATRIVKEKVLRIAAAFLEVAPEDLQIQAGIISARGAPRTAMPLANVAMAAYLAPENLPAGEEMGLESVYTFNGGKGGWSQATHVCWVEIDPQTGMVAIPRYLVVEDCGKMINPAIVEGQIRGGVAQGIGAVLYERAAYAADGQFQAATFMDYLLPTSAEIPEIEIEHMESEPNDEVNYLGVGEGGAVLAPAALTSAIEDALAPFGVTIVEQYLPPSRILELIGTIAVER